MNGVFPDSTLHHRGSEIPLLIASVVMTIIMVIIEVISMKDIPTSIPISKAKSDLLEIIQRLQSVKDAVAVTKNGVPAAVILSMEKYQGLLETLDILSDEKAMKSLRTSLRQPRKGKWLKYDEVFGP
jgi:antitoxin YefM